MKTNLLFEFSVDEDNNSISVKREFAASRTRVWDAWTQSELLDQWWAPKPYKVETKSMDFGEGGQWCYAMVSPEDEKQWCRFDFRHVTMGEGFSGVEVFCDVEGNDAGNLPKTVWTNHFHEKEGITMVDILLKFESAEDLNGIIEMGFEEGFKMALENLDEVLGNGNW